MKKVRITLATTEAGTYCKVHGSMPALLWADILHALNDYQKFEQGKKGTRYDTWLEPKKA